MSPTQRTPLGGRRVPDPLVFLRERGESHTQSKREAELAEQKTIVDTQKSPGEKYTPNLAKENFKS